MKAGLGFSALQMGPLKVGAIVAVNACGDIFYPNSDKPIAGIYDKNTNTRLFSEDEILKAAEKDDQFLWYEYDNWLYHHKCGFK